MPGQLVTSGSQSQSTSQPRSLGEVLPFRRLDVYVAAGELAALVHSACISDPELRDQATRAAKSCFLALAEGLPHESTGQRARYFATSKASLCEAVAALAARVSRMLGALRRPGGATARAG